MAERTDVNASIANGAKTAMKARGLTHPDTAVTAGITPRTFERLLTGNFDWKVADVIALQAVLGVELLAVTR